MRKALVLASLAAALAACGDNWDGGGGDDNGTIDGGPIDAPGPDAFVCQAPAPGAVGGGCAMSTDCDSATGAGDGLCYVGNDGPTIYPPEGYCTLDNMAGTVCSTDGDCGAGNVCVNFTDFDPYKVCMPDCTCGGTASSSCGPHQACFDSFNGFALDKSACVPGTQGARDGAACAGFYDCDDFSTCLLDNLEYPGGECAKYGCTVGDDTTCHGGVCVTVDDPPLSGTLCVDACDTDTDCRQAEGYSCFDPGGGDQKYCRHPHVGDACSADGDCGSAVWTCETGVTFPGGYCTAVGCPTPGSSEGCGLESICYDDPLGTDNYCADRCTNVGSITECRTGYQCVDTDPAGNVTTPGCVPL